MQKSATANCPEQIRERGLYITTYSGKRFYINDCNIADIPIEDIAHALSMNCRFNGHVNEFYSVAEHSVLVSKLVPKEYALWGLLHDVTEAFVPDIPRPFKSLIGGFDEFEAKLAEQVAEHYNMPWPMPEEVHNIDHNIVADEAAVLFQEEPDWIGFYESVCPRQWIEGMAPWQAKIAFIERYEELTRAVL